MADIIKEHGGVWDAVKPKRAPPPAVNLPVLEVIEGQMEIADTTAVSEVIAVHADIVDTVAYVAQNLAGTAKKVLRLAALVGKAGPKILAKRVGDPTAQADQRMEALSRKVQRLEKEGREKDAKIAELERRCDELRNSESLMAAGGSPNLFQRAILSSSLYEGEREVPVLGDGVGGGERTPMSRASGPSPSSPGWLPSTKKVFEAYLERTVLGRLSTYMDKWMTEDWEPRALRILKRLESVASRRPSTPTVEWDTASVPGSAQNAEPETPAGSGVGGNAAREADPGTPVETGEVGLAGREKPGTGKRKRGKDGAPTPSPEESKRPSSTQPDAPWCPGAGTGGSEEGRKSHCQRGGAAGAGAAKAAAAAAAAEANAAATAAAADARWRKEEDPARGRPAGHNAFAGDRGSTAEAATATE